MKDCFRGDSEASLGHLKFEGPGTTCGEASRRVRTGDEKKIGVIRAQAGLKLGW